MKDMSEEKECIHSFRGNDYLCIKCGKYFPETVEVCGDYGEAKERHDVVNEFIRFHHNPIVYQKNEEIKSLESRLKEAEAEIKDRADTEQSLTNWVADDGEKIRALEQRLSHLMDVAGKMAGALEHLIGSLESGEMEWSGVDLGIAKLALAEWDGIKKEGGL